MTTVGTDFPNYYTSARLLAEGKAMDRLYDDGWFQQQIRIFGIDQEGKFSPYPPITAFVMLPLVFLQPLNALRVWTVLNIGCLAAGIILLSRVTNKSVIWSSLLFLLSGHALANNFKFGQFYIILNLLVIAGYQYWILKHPTFAGVTLGIGAALKYFPILFLALFAFRREWKIALSGIISIAVLVFVGVAFMGLNVHEQFVSTVLGNHLAGNIQNPYSPVFQSWNSLFRRWFVYDPILNSSPLLHSSVLYAVSLLVVYSVVAALFLVAYRKSTKRFAEHAPSLQFALAGIAGLLLLPASATYHFLLLILPVAIILRTSNWTFEQWSLAVLFALIGFIPYSYFSRFENDGILAILAYPRLILTTLIFFSAFMYATSDSLSSIHSLAHNNAHSS